MWSMLPRGPFRMPIFTNKNATSNLKITETVYHAISVVNPQYKINTILLYWGKQKEKLENGFNKHLKE